MEIQVFILLFRILTQIVYLIHDPVCIYKDQMNVFVGTDPARQNFNAYVFVLNDPVNRVDKDGKFSIEIQFQGQALQFEVHREFSLDKIPQEKVEPISQDITSYIGEQLEKGVNPKLVQARLLYGGDQKINAIFENVKQLTGGSFPYVRSESKGIALGLSMMTPTSDDLIKDFAISTQSSSFRTWSSDGYELKRISMERDYMSQSDELRSAMEISGELQQSIHFNLDYVDLEEACEEIEQINKTIENDPSMIWDDNLLGRYGFTNFELRQILHHRAYYDRTIFYRNGQALGAEEQALIKEIRYMGK